MISSLSQYTSVFILKMIVVLQKHGHFNKLDIYFNETLLLKILLEFISFLKLSSLAAYVMMV